MVEGLSHYPTKEERNSHQALNTIDNASHEPERLFDIWYHQLPPHPVCNGRACMRRNDALDDLFRPRRPQQQLQKGGRMNGYRPVHIPGRVSAKEKLLLAMPLRLQKDADGSRGVAGKAIRTTQTTTIRPKASMTPSPPWLMA